MERTPDEKHSTLAPDVKCSHHALCPWYLPELSFQLPNLQIEWDDFAEVNGFLQKGCLCMIKRQCVLPCLKKKNPIPFFSQIHRPSTFAGQLMTLMCASPSPAIFCKWQMPALSQKMYLFICFCQMNSARGWNLFSSFSFSFLQWYEQMDLPERCCTLLMLKCWIYFTLTSAAPVNTTAVTESVQNYYNCSWYEN